MTVGTLNLLSDRYLKAGRQYKQLASQSIFLADLRLLSLPIFIICTGIIFHFLRFKLAGMCFKDINSVSESFKLYPSLIAAAVSS
jgi:hypothetical protein